MNGLGCHAVIIVHGGTWLRFIVNEFEVAGFMDANSRKLMSHNFSTGAGGAHSVPETAFAGGALIGSAGGFVSMAHLQGTHLAMKTGMLAADAAFSELQVEPKSSNLHMQGYHRSLRDSWVMHELNQVSCMVMGSMMQGNADLSVS
jgi:hypothetical protein